MPTASTEPGPLIPGHSWSFCDRRSLVRSMPKCFGLVTPKDKKGLFLKWKPGSAGQPQEKCTERILKGTEISRAAWRSCDRARQDRRGSGQHGQGQDVTNDAQMSPHCPLLGATGTNGRVAWGPMPPRAMILPHRRDHKDKFSPF